MRVRKLALAVGLVSALGGNVALALGLGEIKLNSTLNQPLDAEISLLQTRGLDDSEIKVRLASPEDFERAGVERSYLHTELQFDVVYSGGQPVIRVTSRSPIREPYLNFLVETRWPSGRLLREYTLLMDLPAFSDNSAEKPVRAAERERQQVRRETAVPQSQQQAMPVHQTQPTPAEEQVGTGGAHPSASEPMNLNGETSAGESGSRVYGPVAANQTLWEIAVQNRVSREFSVQQTMLAIQRLNPEAFIDDNINLLKKGAVLRLPEAADIRALSAREAISEVAVQNSSWRERIGDEVTTGAPLDARAAVEETSGGETLEGRVTLAAPGDNESVLSGSGSGTEDSEALAGELTVAEEELDKSRLENEELQERIAELDEQIDTMERLVEVSNDELAAVQAAAEQSEPEINPIEAGEEAGEAEPVDEEPVAEDVAAEEVTAEAASDDSAVEPAAKEPEPAPKEVDRRNQVVVVKTSPEPTLVERLMDNIYLVAIGAVVLLGGLFGFFTWRRRKEEEEAMLQVEREMAAERALAEAPEVAEKDENLAAVESLESSENFDFGGLDDVSTDDPISEAEIHLSLGQYDEAEGKLLAGLAQDAQNVDARLMLLEVYAHKQDAGKFDEHYRELLRISDGPAADRAARLRESIAGAPPFEAPEMNLSSESLEAAQLDDISTSFEEDFSSEDPLAADTSANLEDDTSLLDDLTMDLSDDSSASLAQEEDLELSLDLDDDFGGAAPAEESEEGEISLDDLDLGDLDLDLDKPSASEGETEQEETEQEELGPIEYARVESESSSEEAFSGEAESGGLDFDLDLSPMDDGGEPEPEPEQKIADAEADFADEAELSLDDLSADLDAMDEALGADLDLDAIDLDDIAGELSADLAAEESQQGDDELAVAEKPQPAAAEQAPSAAAEESDLGDLSFNLENDLDSELNLLEGSDEISTKLELAQAYLDMGDKDGAKDILSEVVQEGSGEHKARAEEMLERIT